MSRVNGRGVPACATLWLGLLSAVCALLFPLDVLIEMMSVGTLLAYTLVDCCVLILRFQPERRTIIEQLERAELEVPYTTNTIPFAYRFKYIFS